MGKPGNTTVVKMTNDGRAVSVVLDEDVTIDPDTLGDDD